MVALKFLAVSGLNAVIGMIAGCIFLPRVMSPPSPVVIDGHTYAPCGLAIFPMMFEGGLIGLIVGAVLGVCVAYLLLKPSPPTNT